MKCFAKFILIPLFLSPVVMNGCATGQPEREAMPIPVFPSPPDEPRFTYERTLLSSADVEIESEESAFERMITGARRTGIGMGKPFGITVHQGRVFNNIFAGS